MKTFKYVLGYLLLIQLTLPYLVPFSLIYNYRMDYNLVKDNLYNIDVILDQISMQINEENLQDYIIILGDSIAFSGPGNAGQSIGCYMQQLAQKSTPSNPARIYNLAMPAMQTGDIYTMLLKLDEHHISTENVIINVEYKGFIKRQPGPPIVFWLKDELKSLDKESFNWASANLKANNYKEQFDIQTAVHRVLWDKVEIFRYSSFMKKGLINVGQQIRGAKPLDDSIGDARPWFEKEGLKEVLQRDEYQQEFSDQDFDMSINNPQIYFLEKIIDHQKNKQTLVFLAAANAKLMSDKVTAPGYVHNIQQIDNYFRNQPVRYLNVYGKIDSGLFSDHLHLTADGYRELAKMLWDNFEIGAKS